MHRAVRARGAARARGFPTAIAAAIALHAVFAAAWSGADDHALRPALSSSTHADDQPASIVHVRPIEQRLDHLASSAAQIETLNAHGEQQRSAIAANSAKLTKASVTAGRRTIAAVASEAAAVTVSEDVGAGMTFIDVAAGAADAASAPPAAAAPAADAGDLAPQKYATKIAPTFTFRYAMRRGQIAGTGELRWTKDGDRYEAQLKGTVGGLSILSWTSTGGFDAAGIAPVRYVDQRLARSPQAANFQRTENKVTYSGSTNEFQLAAGAQDRLSWMIQLPAILDADHARARPGSRVAMAVSGAHADYEDYVFRCSGSETVETPLGQITALKWVREQKTPHDNRVEVWLDPSRRYLPVQARLSSSGSDTPLELELQESSP